MPSGHARPATALHRPADRPRASTVEGLLSSSPGSQRTSAVPRPCSAPDYPPVLASQWCAASCSGSQGALSGGV
jgi:hypothetical protein